MIDSGRIPRPIRFHSALRWQREEIVARQAHAHGVGEGDGGRRAWSGFAAIAGNWANALALATGDRLVHEYSPAVLGFGLATEPDWLTQVHGTDVRPAGAAGPVEADAAVARAPGATVAVLTGMAAAGSGVSDRRTGGGGAGSSGWGA